MGGPSNSEPDVTLLLGQARGDADSASRLLAIVYEQLRAVAQHQMAQEGRGHTLQATALVHEAYLRLVGEKECGWVGRGQFYVAAAEAMRRILIEHARAKGRIKRGGGRERSLADISGVADLAAAESPEETLALDEAIRRVGELDAQAGEVVRLRFYAGLSIGQTAAALGLSERTVKRDWSFARAWLYRHLGALGDAHGDGLDKGQGDLRGGG